MLLLKEALLLTSVEALTLEIIERRKLIDQMVGSLYPRILESEIEKILERIKEINHD